MPPKFNNKQVTVLYDAITQGDDAEVAKLVLEAPELLCQVSDENQSILEIALDANKQDLILPVVETSEFPLQLLFQLLITRQWWHVVEKVCSMNLTINAATMVMLYEQVPTGHFEKIMTSCAKKKVDELLAKIAKQQANEKLASILQNGQNMELRDLHAFFTACSETMNKAMVQQFLECQTIQYDRTKLEDAICLNLPVLSMFEGMPFPGNEEMDALCNPQTSLETLRQILESTAKSKPLFAVQLITKILQQDPEAEVPYNLLSDMDMKYSVRAFFKKHPFNNSIFLEMDFFKLVEASGYEWTDQNIKEVFALNVLSNESDILEYMARKCTISESCIESIVKRGHFSVFKIIAAKQPVDVNKLVKFANTLEMIQEMVAIGATLTPKMVASVSNYETFNAVLKAFNLDISYLKNENLSSFLYQIHRLRIRFLQDYGIVNDSCIEPFCYALIDSYGHEAIEFFVALSKHPRFVATFFNKENSFVANLLVKNDINAAAKYILQLNPQVLDDSILFEFYDVSYGDTDLSPDDFIAYSIRNKKWNVVTFLWQNFKCIAQRDINKHNLNAYNDFSKTMDGMHMFVETLNQYGDTKPKLSENCPKSQLEWFNSLQRIQVLQFASKTTMTMVVYDTAQLIRSIKRKLRLSNFKKYPLLSMYDAGTQQWQWLTDATVLDAKLATLNVFVHTTWYLRKPIAFTDLHVQC